MATVVGLALLGLLCVVLAADLLQRGPTHASEDDECPGCGWPPWSCMPCLCDDDAQVVDSTHADHGV